MTTNFSAQAIAAVPEVMLLAAQRCYLIATEGEEHYDEWAIIDRYGHICDYYCGGDSDLAYEVLGCLYGNNPAYGLVTSLDEALEWPGQPKQLSLF